ncbi:conserved hypothetical protein [Cenarchaeum symbiosum A]|uniref:Uncharacterized protein n=1 Tax=Cenarchaeum symbiosum (strain A) TaxID=414004 RepID=A0RV40_CENSY|nr:conserved hypothetical protein [Cenarchaeum symbiosum A]
MALAAVLPLLLAGGMASSSAVTWDESTWDEDLYFAAAVDGSMAHLRALDLNLQDRNGPLAEAHALHLMLLEYPKMEWQLQADPDFDERLVQTLQDVQVRATIKADPEDAQASMDDAAAILEEARMLVVGDELSRDKDFKLSVIVELLKMAKFFYDVGVSDGEVVALAEFQQSSALVWRSDQILSGFSGDLHSGDLVRVNGLLEEIDRSFSARSNPDFVLLQMDALIKVLESNVDRMPGEMMDDKMMDEKMMDDGHMAGDEHMDDGHMEDEMMGDNMMDDDKMMGDNMMDGDEMMGDNMMDDDKMMDDRMMGDKMMDDRMMGDKMMDDRMMGDKMMDDRMMGDKMMDGMVLPPLKQIMAGVEPAEIECMDGFELLFGPSGRPACIMEDTVSRLVQAGWTS